MPAGKPKLQITDTDRYTGMYVIGEKRSGKTTFLENQIVAQAEAGRAVIVIEGHGDLSHRLLTILPPERERDIILLDGEDTVNPFGLNILERPEDPRMAGRMATRTMELFRKIWGDDWGPTIEQNFQFIALTAYDNPGLTLDQVPRLFEDADFRAPIVRNIRDGDLRRWWGAYELKNRHDKGVEVDSTLRRVRPWSMNPLLKPIIRQKKSTINWREAMDTGKIVIVRLPKEPILGETIVKLLGTALINQITIAAFSRSDIGKEARRPVALFCDEFHLFSTPDFDDLLNGGGKFHIMTAVAHQQLIQLRDAPNVQAAAAGAGIKVVFRVSGDDAIQLAKHFDHTPTQGEATGSRAVMIPSQDQARALVKGHTNPEIALLTEWTINSFVTWEEGIRSGKYNRDKRPERMLDLMNAYFNLLIDDNTAAGTYAEVKAVAGFIVCQIGVSGVIEDIEALVATMLTTKSTPLGYATTYDEFAPSFSIYEGFAAYMTSTVNAEFGWRYRVDTEDDEQRDFNVQRPRWDVPEDSVLIAKRKVLLARAQAAAERTLGGYEDHQQLARIQRIADAAIKARGFREPDGVHGRLMWLASWWGLYDRMVDLARLVMKEPILINSGRQEPTYTQRTYADMENEITTKLAHLPDFHAMVRVGNDERIVAMPPPLPEHRRLYPTIPEPPDDEDEPEVFYEEPPPKPKAPPPVPPPVRKPPPRR